MNQRTEPTKDGNEVAIAELKRETRGTWPLKYRDARSGIAVTSYDAYKVVATADDGQSVTVAIFPYDDFDEGRRRETARIMAEELAERINAA